MGYLSSSLFYGFLITCFFFDSDIQSNLISIYFILILFFAFTTIWAHIYYSKFSGVENFIFLAIRIIGYSDLNPKEITAMDTEAPIQILEVVVPVIYDGK